MLFANYMATTLNKIKQRKGTFFCYWYFGAHEITKSLQFVELVTQRQTLTKMDKCC